MNWQTTRTDDPLDQSKPATRIELGTIKGLEDEIRRLESELMGYRIGACYDDGLIDILDYKVEMWEARANYAARTVGALLRWLEADPGWGKWKEFMSLPRWVQDRLLGEDDHEDVL